MRLRWQRERAAKVGLHFPLLSDPSAQVIRQYRMFNPPMSMAHMGYVLILSTHTGACRPVS